MLSRKQERPPEEIHHKKEDHTNFNISHGEIGRHSASLRRSRCVKTANSNQYLNLDSICRMDG